MTRLVVGFWYKPAVLYGWLKSTIDLTLAWTVSIWTAEPGL